MDRKLLLCFGGALTLSGCSALIGEHPKIFGMQPDVAVAVGTLALAVMTVLAVIAALLVPVIAEVYGKAVREAERRRRCDFMAVAIHEDFENAYLAIRQVNEWLAAQNLRELPSHQMQQVLVEALHFHRTNAVLSSLHLFNPRTAEAISLAIKAVTTLRMEIVHEGREPADVQAWLRILGQAETTTSTASAHLSRYFPLDWRPPARVEIGPLDL